MGAFVDHKAGDAAVEGHVSHILQRSGVIAPGIAGQSGGRKGFRRGQVLPVHMGDGCRLPDIGKRHFQGGTAAGSGNPEGAHGHVRRHLEIHAIPHVHTAVLVRFRIPALHPVFPDNVVDPVIILREELAEGLAPVEKEFLAVLAAPDNLACQDREPGNQIVAATGLELLRQGGCPGHLLRLVAVRKEILDATLPHKSPGRILVHVQISAEIIHPGSPVQFIDLQARG